MEHKPEMLRSCLKTDEEAVPPNAMCLTPLTSKRVSFAVVNEVREYTPTATDESTESTISPDRTIESPMQRFILHQSPSEAYDLSPAPEIELDSMLMASQSQLETSKSYEPGIEDVTAGILNDTSDDFVCSIINSVDMSMTVMSDGDGDQTLTESATTTQRFTTTESEEVAVPDICDDMTIKEGKPTEEPVSHPMIPKGPSDGVWKKFRIASPFSVKPQPTVQIRLISSSSVPAPSCSVAAAEVQTSPYSTFTKESTPYCMSQASSTVSLATSLKDSTLPFSSDGESGQDDESCQQSSLPASFPTNIPRFKTLFHGKKESKDPMKKIKGTKIRKATTKKKKNNNSQHWKSHLGNLVERLRSVGIDYDTSCFDDMSPERPAMRLDSDSPEPEITDRKGNYECLMKSSKIPRPVDSLSQVKISTLQGVGSFRRRIHSADGIPCLEVKTVQSKDAIRLKIGREISQIRELRGVRKVRKLESFAKQYLRHLDNETFEWAIAQLSGSVYPEFIKAEEEYRRIKELVAENPKFKTGDPSDPWWIWSQAKMKEMIEKNGCP